MIHVIKKKRNHRFKVTKKHPLLSIKGIPFIYLKPFTYHFQIIMFCCFRMFFIYIVLLYLIYLSTHVLYYCFLFPYLILLLSCKVYSNSFSFRKKLLLPWLIWTLPWPWTVIRRMDDDPRLDDPRTCPGVFTG